MVETLLALMALWRPPQDLDDERYLTSIAQDMSDVALEVGKDNADALALSMLAVAIHESGLRPEVDDGTVRGEGVDVCLMQIRTTRARADQLAADRRECLRVGARLVRSSFATCRANPWSDRLAAYASGRCSAGQQASREIMAIRDRLAFARHRLGGPTRPQR